MGGLWPGARERVRVKNNQHQRGLSPKVGALGLHGIGKGGTLERVETMDTFLGSGHI